MVAMSVNYTQPQMYRDTGHLRAGQMSRRDMSRSLGDMRDIWTGTSSLPHVVGGPDVPHVPLPQFHSVEVGELGEGISHKREWTIPLRDQVPQPTKG